MYKLFIILFPFYVFAQFDLTDIEYFNIIPQDIAGTIYCKMIYQDGEFTEFNGYKVIGKLSVNIFEFSNQIMTCTKILIGTREIEGKSYYYIVEGQYTANGKLKQKVIRYLGNVETIIKKFDFWEKHH